jgi:nitrogen regulatory protein P-II 1
VKRISAIIRSNRLDEVKKCLIDAGVEGMTVAEVRGFGRQRGHTEVYRGSEYSVDFVPKILVTILAPDERIEAILEAIILGARTGKMGDGKIYIAPVEEVVRIRNGERGETAI